MGFGTTELLIIFALLLPIAFLPTIIATRKKHPQKVLIILTNIFGMLLWGIGWLIALIWCFIEPNKNNSSPSNVASEIEKLHELKEKGVITQDEFNLKKKAFLET